MNSTYSITSKFQVTIPRDAREKLGISSNDRVKFTTKNHQLIVERVPSMQEVANDIVANLKRYGIKPATDEDIKNARFTFYSKELK